MIQQYRDADISEDEEDIRRNVQEDERDNTIT
jgi:hypothetical protein